MMFFGLNKMFNLRPCSYEDDKQILEMAHWRLFVWQIACMAVEGGVLALAHTSKEGRHGVIVERKYNA